MSVPLSATCDLGVPLSAQWSATRRQVRKSEAPRAPPHTLDIVSHGGGHVFTLCPPSKEEQLRWVCVIAKAIGGAQLAAGATAGLTAAAVAGAPAALDAAAPAAAVEEEADDAELPTLGGGGVDMSELLSRLADAEARAAAAEAKAAATAPRAGLPPSPSGSSASAALPSEASREVQLSALQSEEKVALQSLRALRSRVAALQAEADAEWKAKVHSMAAQAEERRKEPTAGGGGGGGGASVPGELVVVPAALKGSVSSGGGAAARAEARAINAALELGKLVVFRYDVTSVAATKLAASGQPGGGEDRMLWDLFDPTDLDLIDLGGGGSAPKGASLKKRYDEWRRQFTITTEATEWRAGLEALQARPQTECLLHDGRPRAPLMQGAASCEGESPRSAARLPSAQWPLGGLAACHALLALWVEAGWPLRAAW